MRFLDKVDTVIACSLGVAVIAPCCAIILAALATVFVRVPWAFNFQNPAVLPWLLVGGFATATELMLAGRTA